MVRVVMTPGWRGKIKEATRPHVNRIATDVAFNARTNIVAEPNIVTGAMLNSVRMEPTGVAALTARVWIGTDHWHFIEYGTAAHIITPNTKQALYWPGARHPVAKVRHPGTKEYAPMRRALHRKRSLRGV